ncbi:MAG: hypothetical protein JWR83_2587 [Aeromicrobium sp.]|nr:hypothetical protein [Aeromicrobium sp.]
MSVGDAAQLLGVTEKQVQHLGRRGEVRYVARGLLDGASVRAIQAVRQGRHTRGWSGRTAWAAIALLSGHDADWLGQGQVSRLRSRLRIMGSDDLVAATRNRALVSRFTGHRSAVGRLAGDSSTVERRALPGLVGRDHHAETDWYVDARKEDYLVRTYGLRSNARGDFVLRAVKTEDRLDRDGVNLHLVISLMMDDVLTALDSATSEDPRERGVAMQVLDDALDRFRDDD